MLSVVPLSCGQSSWILFMFSIVLRSIPCWMSSRNHIYSHPGFYSVFSIVLRSMPCWVSSHYHVDSYPGFFFYVKYRHAFYSVLSIVSLSCWQSSWISFHVHFMFSIILRSIRCWISSRGHVDSRPGFHFMVRIVLRSVPCCVSSCVLFHVQYRPAIMLTVVFDFVSCSLHV